MVLSVLLFTSKNNSDVSMFVSLAANVKLSLWVSLSNNVTVSLPSLSSKFFMTTFSATAPLEEKVTVIFSFSRTIFFSEPFLALKNNAEESFFSSSSFAACFSFSANSLCCSAFCFATFSIESLVRCASICSFEGWLYHVKPNNTAAMSTNPIRVFLSTC